MSAEAWGWLGDLELTADGPKARPRVQDAKAVLIVLAYYADPSGISSTSQDDLVAHTALSARTVSRVMRDLRDAGVVTVLHGSTTWQPVTYQLNMDVTEARLGARPESRP